MVNWTEWRMPSGELAQLKFAVVPVALAPFASSDGAIEWVCENGVVGMRDCCKGRKVVRNPAACAAGGGTDGGARACAAGGRTDGGALIADLEACKKSLIFETVTGKREVA